MEDTLKCKRKFPRGSRGKCAERVQGPRFVVGLSVDSVDSVEGAQFVMTIDEPQAHIPHVHCAIWLVVVPNDFSCAIVIDSIYDSDTCRKIREAIMVNGTQRKIRADGHLLLYPPKNRLDQYLTPVVAALCPFGGLCPCYTGPISSNKPFAAEQGQR